MSRNKSQADPVQLELGALERAVLKIAEHYDDTTVHGLVNCVLRGWIRGGRFTREYRELAARAEENRRISEESENRVAALRDSIASQMNRSTTSPTGGITSG